MRRLPALLTMAALAGCTVGPNYQRPVIAAAAGNWIAPLDQGAVDQRWWARLGDPQLDALVDAALAANLDLVEAQARLREARANRDAAAGKTLPEVKASGSAIEQQLSKNGQLPVGKIPGLSRRFSLFDVGFDASWELDLWGATRRSVEAASDRVRQSAAQRDSTQLQLVAEVARSYADLRAAQAREQALAAAADARGESARLTELRFRAGESSRLEANQAEQLAADARAALSEPRAAATAAIYRLGLLTARAPGAWLPALAPRAALPSPPALVPAGVRSELLQRRPDVQAAEAELAAATADVGVATADLYPRFSLAGSIGQQARHVGDLPSGGSTRFSIGPSFSWPIFNFGRIRAQIRAAKARADGAGARYERAVLTALNDSETAANRYANTRTAEEQRTAAVARARGAADLAALRFRRGEDDRLRLLDAQATLSAEELQLASAKADVLTAWIAFNKALGGGALK
ncbi:efflux transporter outer membrane subunit [Sphingomonas sp. KRR8]|uniref:efflux transporter outer membrane subunit n=1 Tax=Sphingomonas sp. KRR8 TaxID=2942996 RepID=UPI0020201000|nr:efflux transporter outer membrane subunit [Sphingomonas sp. KRR8]URD60712.1 efflux transporter outer membrane subunit [Sphingomonas sp. KRR8]